MRDSAEVLGAQAVGLLVVAAHGSPELLSATSHQMTELELFQVQHDSGPCIEAIRGGTPSPPTAKTTSGPGGRSPARPSPAPATTASAPTPCAGATAPSAPSTSCTATARRAPADAGLIAQALADVATAVIVQAAGLTADQVTESIEQAPQARTVIEQAKGVLACAAANSDVRNSH